jgi:hypothetical protein
MLCCDSDDGQSEPHQGCRPDTAVRKASGDEWLNGLADTHQVTLLLTECECTAGRTDLPIDRKMSCIRPSGLLFSADDHCPCNADPFRAVQQKVARCPAEVTHYFRVLEKSA